MFAQAAVEFPTKTIDIGTVCENVDSVNCVFQVVNRGDAPLFIEGVYVSCGCVRATHSKDAIMPNESGTVTATLFPKGQDGRFLKSIYVYTNTIPRKNVVRLKVPKITTDWQVLMQAQRFILANRSSQMSCCSWYVSCLNKEKY